MSPTVAVRAIRNNADMDAAMERLRQIWEPEPGTSEADEAEVLTILIQAYDKEHYPVPSSDDPVETIYAYLENRGLGPEFLIPYLGAESIVTEVLERKRPLTVEMIRNLHRKLGIAAEDLIGA